MSVTRVHVDCRCKCHSSLYFMYVDGVFCRRTWDSVSCWPATVAGQRAVVSCPEQLGGVPIDTTRKHYG